jgi:hypothetical protein
MKKFKIPVKFETSGIIEIEAKDLGSAIHEAMGVTEADITEFSDLKVGGIGIVLPDNERLEEMYPREIRQMREDEKPFWEKKGWKECGRDCWEKDGVTISNSFDDVGWGFVGTVSLPNGWSKGGFDSLEDAIAFAEKEMGW